MREKARQGVQFRGGVIVKTVCMCELQDRGPRPNMSTGNKEQESDVIRAEEDVVGEAGGELG